MSKYHNRKILTADGTFDSAKEYNRWQELKLMEKGGAITDLKRQVRFNLIPFQRMKSGKGVPKCDYIADFAYMRDGKLVVEDTKGVQTDVFKIKAKLMLWVHGIEVQIV